MGFTIPADESFAVVKINSETGTGTMTNVINPTDDSAVKVTGLSLYTTKAGGNAGDAKTVQLYSFNLNGELAAGPITLSTAEVKQAEFELKQDLNDNGVTGVRINNKLATLPAIGSSQVAAIYATTGNELLISNYTSLDSQQDFSNIPHNHNEHHVILRDENGIALTNSAGGIINLAEQSITALYRANSEGSGNTYGVDYTWELILQSDLDDSIKQLSFHDNGNLIGQQSLNEVQTRKLEAVTGKDLNSDGIKVALISGPIVNTHANTSFPNRLGSAFQTSATRTTQDTYCIVSNWKSAPMQLAKSSLTVDTRTGGMTPPNPASTKTFQLINSEMLWPDDTQPGEEYDATKYDVSGQRNKPLNGA